MSIAAALAVAFRTHRQLDGTHVAYRRGDREIPDLAVARGVTDFQTNDVTTGAIVAAQSQDFLIMADELVLDDQPILPERGDKIALALDDGEHVFELLELPDSRCWRFSDQHRVRLRVHTQEISTPAA